MNIWEAFYLIAGLLIYMFSIVIATFVCLVAIYFFVQMLGNAWRGT